MTYIPEQTAVVVGVDGDSDSGSGTIIAMAAEEARRRQAALAAVMTFGRDPALGAPAARPVATMRTVDEERIVAESATAAA
jgi:hypothetical protein